MKNETVNNTQRNHDFETHLQPNFVPCVHENCGSAKVCQSVSSVEG